MPVRPFTTSPRPAVLTSSSRPPASILIPMEPPSSSDTIWLPPATVSLRISDTTVVPSPAPSRISRLSVAAAMASGSLLPRKPATAFKVLISAPRFSSPPLLAAVSASTNSVMEPSTGWSVSVSCSTMPVRPLKVLLSGSARLLISVEVGEMAESSLKLATAFCTTVTSPFVPSTGSVVPVSAVLPAVSIATSLRLRPANPAALTAAYWPFSLTVVVAISSLVSASRT